jgi:hypothetical protein
MAGTAAPSPVRDAEPLGRAAWWPAVRFCLAVYLGLRVALSLLALLVTSLVPNSYPVGVPGWPAVGPSQPWHHAFTGWERWDALWYLSIADSGYDPQTASAAFFPLFPLLVSLVGGALGDRPLLGAYVVSNVALVVGLVLLHRLTELELGAAVARRAVLLLCVLPTAFFLFAPYTESLFLALSVGCVYAARRRAWLLAGALGALASATRSTGVLLAVALLVEGVLQLRERAPGRAWWRVALPPALACAAVPAGLLVYLLQWRAMGQWDRPLELQASNWNKVQAWPWETLQAGVTAGLEGLALPDRSFRTLDLVLVLGMLAVGALVTRRVRLTHVAYFWVSALFPLLLMDPDRPLQSVPRYYLVVYPVAWGLALLAQRQAVRDVLVPVLALGLGVVSLLFVTWHPVF